ncbi:hypothetical protein [Luteimonas deserti]|uniref:Uncharacterized protein n=1 Tax=Luteimonas deserti TaxID=2752306 RepID=A0A7Z0QQ72_9GAMM|nr:hypothetical protein [Luteimonas deserti]NYZ61802.1 hypothetical protein [Luteimonas deserti]
MSGQKLVALTRMLAERTERGELKWEESERPGVFQVSFSNSSVRILHRDSRLQRGSTEYVISIINSLGVEVDEIGDESMPTEGAYSLMKQMYEQARRKAMGVDTAIDSIIEDLESGIF